MHSTPVRGVASWGMLLSSVFFPRNRLPKMAFRNSLTPCSEISMQGIATAKLPIGDYVALSSSSVMCTNHVVEIMIRQQELGDWRAAFEAVIPTRKRKAGDTSDAVPEDNVPAVKEEPCPPACAPAPQKQKKDKAAVKGAAATKPRKATASVGK